MADVGIVTSGQRPDPADVSGYHAKAKLKSEE
jgi:hypothetical protein